MKNIKAIIFDAYGTLFQQVTMSRLKLMTLPKEQVSLNMIVLF